jgi:hypothetical protein
MGAPCSPPTHFVPGSRSGYAAFFRRTAVLRRGAAPRDEALRTVFFAPAAFLRVVVLRADTLRAVALRAVVLRAVFLRAVVLRLVALRAVLLRAVVLRVVFLRVVFLRAVVALRTVVFLRALVFLRAEVLRFGAFLMAIGDLPSPFRVRGHPSDARRTGGIRRRWLPTLYH